MGVFTDCPSIWEHLLGLNVDLSSSSDLLLHYFGVEVSQSVPSSFRKQNPLESAYILDDQPFKWEWRHFFLASKANLIPVERNF